MTAVMGAADILALLGQDLAAGIRAAADLREQRAKAATPGPWVVGPSFRFPIRVISEGKLRPVVPIPGDPWAVPSDVADTMHRPDAEHIAAEANPAHALAAVRSWRGTADRHVPEADSEFSVCRHCVMSGDDGYLSGVESWPCPDLTETADEVRAYLGGTTPASQREEPRP